MWEFINFIANDPSYLAATTIFCMLVIGASLWLFTKSLMIGLVGFEVINCWNLTILVTSPWLGLDIEPFIPWWLSVTLFIFPLIALAFFRIITMEFPKDEGQDD